VPVKASNIGFLNSQNDKDSLCWRENIGEMALYVNGKVSTTYAIIGLGYGEKGFLRGVNGKETYIYVDSNYWFLCLFWLNLDKSLP
jgi:hypothetical protein